MKIKKNFPEELDYHKEDRPWGLFLQFVFNKKCSVKLMKIRRGECISLQRHLKRSQFYYILDDDFAIVYGSTEAKLTKEKVKEGTMYFFDNYAIHRAFYLGEREYGRYLEISFGEYDEEDIERLQDKYERC